MKFALPLLCFPLLASSVPLGHLNKNSHQVENEQKCYDYIQYCLKLEEKMTHIGIPKKDYVCLPPEEAEELCKKEVEEIKKAFEKKEINSEAYFDHDKNGGKEPVPEHQQPQHHGVHENGVQENGGKEPRHEQESPLVPQLEINGGFVELEQAVGSTVIAGSPLPVNEHHRWPSVVIPYCLDASLNGQLQTKMGYLAALKLVADNTNIDLNEVACNDPGHKLKLIFHNNEACSFVGLVQSTGGAGCGNAVYFPAVPPLAGTVAAAAAANTHQVLAFDFVRGNCYTAAHELLHTLGFFHTQMRSDRDTFVTVQHVVDGINCGSAAAFGGTTDAATDYDVESIMHYPRQSGQCGRIDVKENAPQQRLQGVAVKMGQMNSWRDSDTAAVNAAYPLPVG